MYKSIMLFTPILLVAMVHASDYKNERLAAWQHCIVAADEQVPVCAVVTYSVDTPNVPFDTYGLCKIVPARADQSASAEDVRDLRVDYYPGGVKAVFSIAEQTFHTDIFPAVIAEGQGQWKGAAIYRIRSNAPFMLTCGGGDVCNLLKRTDWLRRPLTEDTIGTLEYSEGTLLFSSTAYPIKTVITVSGGRVVNTEKGLATITFEQEGTLVIGFAQDSKTAAELSGLDVLQEQQRVADHYAALLTNRIKTPEPMLDQAFQWAQITLEYNWLKPYGWIEAIGKWPTLWHMQASVAAQWLGQSDRAWECIMTHAEHLMDDGAVPHFNPGFGIRRDFGGGNQFYCWQVLNYWKYTSDMKFAAYMAPKLDRIIAQTQQENDPQDDGLLAWGPQIGNQEDFIKTPHNGTSPTIEYIQMCHTRAQLAAAVGDSAAATRYAEAAERSKAALRRELWMSDLGRFAYYKDSWSMPRLDGQYHTYIYPVIYDILDPLDSWISIRHLSDRFIGTDQTVYTSNNFPSHVNWTAGMAGVSACQPWAARGLADVGRCDDAYLPLLADAKKVMNNPHRGAWHEIDGTEPQAVFFSPPAGMYIWGMVESIFGLRPDVPSGRMVISPSFPQAWPDAAMELKEYSVSYAKKGGTLTYSLHTAHTLAYTLRWKLPLCTVKQVRFNGRKIPFEVAGQVDSVLLTASTEPTQQGFFEINTEPLSYRIQHPLSAAQGETITVSVDGASIDGVVDRCGLFSNWCKERDRLSLTLADALLDPYLCYGRLGLMNFGRRTAFLQLRSTGGLVFYAPLTIAVLPRFEAFFSDVQYSDGALTAGLLLRNNTEKPVSGPTVISVGGQICSVLCDLKPRSESVLTLSLSGTQIFPGANMAQIVLPGKTYLAAQVECKVASSSDAEFRIEQLQLPPELLVSDAEHVVLRQTFPAFVLKRSLIDMDNAQITIPDLPGVTFKMTDDKYIVAAAENGKPIVDIPIRPDAYRKLYILTIAYVDNHDIFSRIGRIDVLAGLQTIASTQLTVPGNLDFYWPDRMRFEFGTFSFDEKNLSSNRFGHPDRFGLLARLGHEDGDWPNARPLEFPQASYWSESLAFSAPRCTMSIIEIPIPQNQKPDKLRCSLYGDGNALAITAITGLCLSDPNHEVQSPK